MTKEGRGKGLLMEIVKYAATASLGAVAVFVATSLNRLPSRALTILPAGIHVLQGSTLTCPDKAFLMGEVNDYLDDEIRTPPCDALLSRNQIADLTAELERAKAAFNKERLGPMTIALDKLHKVEQAPPKDEDEFRSRILQAVANLVYISRHAPSGVPPRELLPLLERDVSRALTDVNMELSRMQQIIEATGGSEAKPVKHHLELYFVVDNSSDIEFYISTHCSLSAGDQKLQLVMDDTKNEDVSATSLVYLPILPGRGKLLKYTLEKSPAQPIANPDLKTIKQAFLSCTLSNNKVIASRDFEPEKFTVREQTF